MTERTWPEQWFAWRDGNGCPTCVGGRVEENEYGARFLAGRFGDAFLERRPQSPGYTVVIFHGRHVADPIDLTDEELAGYWSDIRTAGQLIRSTFQPCHLNYQLLGNYLPHVHTHLIPRYEDDPAPGRPLPEAVWDGCPTLDPAEFDRQLGLLREASSRLQRRA